MFPVKLGARFKSGVAKISLAVCAAGIGLIILGLVFESDSLPRIILQNLGGVFVVAATVNFLWEIWTRHAFLNETLKSINVSKNLYEAGITTYTTDFNRGYDWSSLLNKARRFDAFFSYANTLRNWYQVELEELSRRHGSHVRIVLPDPDDPVVRLELARRFHCQEQELADNISGAFHSLSDLKAIADEHEAIFEIFFLKAPLLYSYYRFDDESVVAFFKHRPGRGNIPTFGLHRGGTMFDYYCDEFDYLMEPENSTPSMNHRLGIAGSDDE